MIKGIEMVTVLVLIAAFVIFSNVAAEYTRRKLKKEILSLRKELVMVQTDYSYLEKKHTVTKCRIKHLEQESSVLGFCKRGKVNERN